MRVCFDVRKLWDSGIGTYIRGLLRGFAETGMAIEWDFIARSSDAGSDLLQRFPGVIQPSRAGNYSINELFSLSRIAKRTQAALFHAPHYILPVGLKMPAVVTIHDIIHLKFPEYFSVPQRAYARFMLNRVKANARMVLTVSEKTREDLVADLHFNPENVVVTYLGVEAQYFQRVSAAAVEEFRAKHSLPRGYLLYVGNLKPHKNVSGLINAWAKLASSIRPPLVIVGTRTDHSSFLQRQVRSLHRDKEAFFVGELSVKELALAYRGAHLYVQPSWYEGFGLPPLEAMASGVPVAVSNRGSLPEIAGESALIFDPGDLDDMVDALECMITITDLRRAFINKGRMRVRNFYWKKTAQLTYQQYQKIAGIA
ncbi:MAG: glycosyltransferase family 1 protein [bacterium]